MRVSFVIWEIEERLVSVLYFLYKIYHRGDHPINEYLKHFVATRNTRASAALGDDFSDPALQN